jgi:hypothetical protein
MLDKFFNELMDDGFIYEVDENGHNMSYGEYAAINQAFEEIVLDEVLSCYELEDAAETLKDLMDCSDDVRCFFYTEEYDSFDYYINDNGTVELYSVPSTLWKHFEDLKERYEEEHYIEEEEEEEEFDMDYCM